MKLSEVKFEDVNSRKHHQYVVQQTGVNKYEAVDVYSAMVLGTFRTAKDCADYLRETDESAWTDFLARTVGAA